MNDKALLVMDMPEKGCISCVIGRNFSSRIETIIFCPIVDRCAKDKEAESQPDWCPLKPIPERMNLDGMRQEAIEEDCYDDTNGIDEAYLQGKETGWNACIDKILEGEEWPY